MLVHKNTGSRGGWQATFFEGPDPIMDRRSASWPQLLSNIHKDSVDWSTVRRANPSKRGTGFDAAWVKGEKRTLRARDKKTRAKRDAELATTGAGCKIKRREITTWCQHRRQQIRDESRAKLDKSKRRRGEVVEAFAMRRGRSTSLRAPKMSKAESDSLAEHNIDARYLDLWREVRHLFPYADAPDKRAELFGEWLEEHQSEAIGWEAARHEGADYGAEEAAYYAAQAS